MLGPERRRGEVAWRHRRAGLRPRGRRRDGHGGAPLQRPHPRGPGARWSGWTRPGATARRREERRRRRAPRHRSVADPIGHCRSAASSPASAATCPTRDRHQRRTRRARVETSDEWIRERTGIRQRHIAGAARDLRLHGHRGGARRAGATPGRGRSEVDAIILATATPDQAFPATARAGAGGARRDQGLRLRPLGRLHRLHLRAVAWPTR